MTVKLMSLYQKAKEKASSEDKALAPRTGLEPVTSWLTVMRSTDWAIEEYKIGIYYLVRWLTVCYSGEVCENRSAFYLWKLSAPRYAIFLRNAESAVLPLHNSAILCVRCSNGLYSITKKYVCQYFFDNIFIECELFIQNLQKIAWQTPNHLI